MSAEKKHSSPTIVFDCKSIFQETLREILANSKFDDLTKNPSKTNAGVLPCVAQLFSNFISWTGKVIEEDKKFKFKLPTQSKLNNVTDFYKRVTLRPEESESKLVHFKGYMADFIIRNFSQIIMFLKKNITLPEIRDPTFPTYIVEHWLHENWKKPIVNSGCDVIGFMEEENEDEQMSADIPMRSSSHLPQVSKASTITTSPTAKQVHPLHNLIKNNNKQIEDLTGRKRKQNLETAIALPSPDANKKKKTEIQSNIETEDVLHEMQEVCGLMDIQQTVTGEELHSMIKKWRDLELEDETSKTYYSTMNESNSLVSIAYEYSLAKSADSLWLNKNLQLAVELMNEYKE